MEEKSGGLLAVWMNIEPAREADFDAWYTRQHVPERVGIPGFLNGNRYEALQGTPRFLAVYDTESPDVLDNAPYRERLNHPTPWTERVMPGFRDTVRCVCRIVAQHGQGTGGILRTCRIEPAPGRRDALATALGGPLLAQLWEQPGVARVRFAETVTTGPDGGTAETAMRGKDQSASFVLLIDATGAEALHSACEESVSVARLLGLGADAPVHVGDYRLLYGLSH